jgi:hypothetical protein
LSTNDGTNIYNTVVAIEEKGALLYREILDSLMKAANSDFHFLNAKVYWKFKARAQFTKDKKWKHQVVNNFIRKRHRKSKAIDYKVQKSGSE